MQIQISEENGRIWLGKSNVSCVRNAATLFRALGKYAGDAGVIGLAAEIEEALESYSPVVKPRAADAATEVEEE